MTHLPFVATSYALGVLLPAAMAVRTALRLRRAARGLALLADRR